MGKIKKTSTSFINELQSLQDYNTFIDNNEDKLTLERLAARAPEFSGNLETPYENLDSEQLDFVLGAPEQAYEYIKEDYLNKIEQDRLEKERLEFLEQQDKAFENLDTDFFQSDLGTSTLYAQKLATDIADKAGNNIPLSDIFNTSEVDKKLAAGVEPLSKLANQARYAVEGGLNDIWAFFSAPLSARLPTFEAFGMDAAQLKIVDKPLKAVNNYLDDVAIRKKTDPNSLEWYDNVSAFFIDNEMSRDFKKWSAENKAISNTYSLSNKSITADRWDAVKDPKYWLDLVVQGGSSAGSFIAAGGAVAKIGKLAGLGAKANQIFTTLALVNVEGTQIATEAANKTFKATLDKHTDDQFTNSENFAISQAVSAAQKEGNISKQDIAKIEESVKNEHLKKFIEENPNAAKYATIAGQSAFTQAASVNNANLLLNLTGAGLLVNGFKQELAKKPLKELGTTFLREGSQEFVEEGVVNNLAEKSGVSVGLTGNYSSSDLTKDLFSLEALEQGIAGFITGGLMGGGAVALNYNNIQDNYNKQQEIIKKYNDIENKNIVDQDLLLNTATALSRGNRVDDLIQQYNLAKASKSDPIAKALESLILAEQVNSAIQSNTLPQLQEMYRKISSKDGNSVETKAKAVEVLSRINKIEQSVRDNYNYLNTSEIVSKEALLENTVEQESELLKNKDVVLDKLTTQLNSIAPNVALNIENPSENPYPYDSEKSTEYDNYNKFLNTPLTKTLLEELETKKDEIYAIQTLKYNTIGAINVSKSDTHQKYLKSKEDLVVKLKSLKQSIFDKNIKQSAKDSNKVDINETYNKIVNGLSATSKEQYNKQIDDILQEHSKKDKSISKKELEVIGKAFKITDELTPNEKQQIAASAQAAVLNNKVEDVKNDEVVENVEVTTKDEKGEVVTPTITDDIVPESVVPTTETVEVVNQATGEVSIVEVPDSSSVTQVELEQPEVIQTLSDLVTNDKKSLEFLRNQVDQLDTKVIKLREMRSNLDAQIGYFTNELAKGYDKDAAEILQSQLDKLKVDYNEIEAEITRISTIINTVKPVIDKGLSGIEAIQLSEELQEVMSVTLTTESVDLLTDEQQEKLSRTMSLLGDTRATVNSAIETDNSVGKVVMEISEESSIVRTKSVPYSKMSIVKSIDYLMNNITIAYNKFIEKIDNPNESILGTIVSYELDTDIIDLFKNSNIQLNRDKGERKGSAALFNFINKGQKYYETGILSDELILEIPVKVKLDNDSYTYLVDNGYFKFIQQDKNGNFVFDDGRTVHPTQFAKYKETVVAEKRKIIEAIMSGNVPQSVIVQKSYGFASRSNTYKALNQLPDYSNNTNFYIIRENGVIDGNGVSSDNVLKTHNINAGTLTVATIGTTGDSILETLQNNKLDRQNAETVIEVIKFILDNPANINEYMELTRSGKTIISGIKPLSVLDLILDLGTINSATDSVFRQEVSIIRDKLSKDTESAIKYVMTKYGTSHLKGINKDLKSAIIALNDAKLNDKTLNPVRDNVVFNEFTNDSSYNDVLATRYSTTLNKLAREKSNIITKLVEAEEILTDNVDGTPANTIGVELPELINNIDDFAALSIEQKNELKRRVTDEINKLPDDVFFLTHLTQSPKNLQSIIKTGLNTGVAIESTTNTVASKNQLISTIHALIDGKIDHAKSSNLIILAFPKSILPSADTKAQNYVEAVSDYIAENYPISFGRNIPAIYNIAAFTNGRLNIINEKPKPTEEFDWDNTPPSNSNTAFSTVSLQELEADGTLPKQRQWLQDNLPQIPAEEYDSILSIANDRIALGYFFTGLEVLADGNTFGIRYSKYQPINQQEKGIIYHEAFHAVVRLLIPQSEYNSLLEIADEETLAEAFRVYMNTGQEFHDDKVNTLFERILNYILNLLGLSNEAKVNKLFKDIATGRYKNTAIRSERISDFGKAFSTVNVSMNPFVAKEAARSLIMAALDNTTLEIVEKITSKDINNILSRSIEIHKERGIDTDEAKAFKSFMISYNKIRYSKDSNGDYIKNDDGSFKEDENNIVILEANKFLESITKDKLKEQAEEYNGEVNTEENEPKDEEDPNEKDDSVSKHTTDSSLLDYELKAPKFIKVLLASLPKKDVNGNDVFNPVTGLREAVDFKSEYTSLLYYLSDSYNDIVVDESVGLESHNLASTKVFEKLKTLAKFKPALRPLYKYLTVNTDTTEDAIDITRRKKSMFYNAVALNRTNYVTVNFDEDVFDTINEAGEVIPYRQFKTSLYETTKADTAFELIKKWAGDSDFINKVVTVNGNTIKYNVAEIARLKNARIKTLEKLDIIDKAFQKENSRLITQEEKNKMYNDAAAEIMTFYKDVLNIDVHKGALDLYAYENAQKNGVVSITLDKGNPNYTRAAFTQIHGLFKDSTYIFGNSKENRYGLEADAFSEVDLKKTFSKFKKSFKPLASYQYLFQDTVGSAAVLGADNKSVFLYDYQSHLVNMFNFMSSGTTEAKKYVQTLSSKAEHSNSLFLEAIASNDISYARLLAFNDKRNGTSTTGVDISLKNDLLSNIHLSLNSSINGYYKSYIRMLSFADKSTSDIYYSVPNRLLADQVTIDTNGNIKVSDRTVDIFYNYLLSELERVFYKGDTDGINLNKNKDKIYLFPEFSPSNSNNNVVAAYIKAVQESIKETTDIREVMDKSPIAIKAEIQKQLAIFLQDEINTYKSIGVSLKEISPELASKYPAEARLESMIAHSAINGVIANIETTKIFTGSVAAYKNGTDFLKRTPFITTKGSNHNIDDPKLSKFNLSVLNTTPYQSTIYNDEVIKSFRAVIEKSYSHYIKEKKLDKTLADFKLDIDARLKNLQEAYTVKKNSNGELENQLDITDAQGYITLDRWYDIMKGLARDSKEVTKLYNKLKSGTADYNDFYKAQAFLQPLKGVIHELNISSSRFVKPINIKYSQFILTPQLVKNSKKLQELYDKMIDQDIQEIVFDTASKGDINAKNDFNSDKLKSIALNKNSWKLQVDFTAKTYKNNPSLVSTQAQKNIRSNIRFNEKYSNGEFGSQLIKNLNKVEATLIFRKSKNFYRNNSLQEFAEKLDTITSTQKEALGSIPFSNLPQLFNAVEGSLNSAIKKQITELKLNGGAFIQTSPEFFTVGVEDGNIRWLIDKKELTGSTLDKSAYILLPYNVIKGLTDEQLATATVDPKVLEGLGVRIPNQPKSSIDKVKIAGFLPRGYGDTVMVYNEGTKKFGYDFDVDKKYIILPDVKYDEATNSISYVEPPKDTNFGIWSDSELRNKLIETWQVLINDHFDEIVEPLDAGWLKEDIVKAGANLETATGLNFYSTSYQLEVKRNNTLAKDLIGPFANFTSDIAANQYAGVYLPYKLGIGNVTEDGYMDLSQAFDEDGNLITNTGLQYQNAAVDAGKDPHIISGNINNYTVGVVTLLVKAGVNRKFPIKLMAQPILKNYTNLISNGMPHYEAIETLKTIRYDSYAQSALSVATTRLDNTFNGDGEVDQDLALYVFDSLYKLAGIDTKQTLASKIDVNGGGSTMVDKFVLQENIRSILHLTVDEFKLFNDVVSGVIPLTTDLAKLFNSKSDVKNFAFKFIDNATATNANRARLTVLGTHYATAVLEPQKIYQNDILMLHPKFQEYAIQISNLLGEQYLTSKKTVKAIYDSFYNYVIKQSFNNNTSSLQSKLDSNTGLASKIREFSGSDPAFAANPLISQLFFNSDPLQNYTFVNIDNKKIKSNKEDVVYGFQQLLDSVHGEKGLEIGNELIEYALQTGVTYNLKSFFGYIPPTAFKERLNLDVNIYTIAEEFFRHNIDNTSIVRPIKGKKKFIGGGVKITTNSVQSRNGVIAPFASAKAYNKITNRVETKLYQFQEYDSKTGDTIYAETYTLGYNTEYGQFNEYGLNSSNTINKHKTVKTILPVDVEMFKAVASYPNVINIRDKRPFESQLIYSMPGTGKTTAMDNNPFIVEPEPYYKELLGNTSILEGQKAITNNYKNREALEPIHQMVADWVSQKLNEGNTVVSGLSFLAADYAKYGLSFDGAVIIDNVETFTDRVRNRITNPIDFTTLDILNPTKEDGTSNFIPDTKKYADLYENYKQKALSLGVNVVSLNDGEFLNDYINGQIKRLAVDNNLNDDIKNPC